MSAIFNQIDPKIAAPLTQLGVSDYQLEQALNYQQDLPDRLEKIMVNMGVLEQEQLVDFYHQYLSMPVYDPLEHDYTLSLEQVQSFNIDKLFELGCLPFQNINGELSVACF